MKNKDKIPNVHFHDMGYKIFNKVMKLLTLECNLSKYWKNSENILNKNTLNTLLL